MKYSRADIGIVWQVIPINPPSACPFQPRQTVFPFEIQEVLSMVIRESGLTPDTEWVLEPRDKLGLGESDPRYIYDVLMTKYSLKFMSGAELRGGLSFNINQHIGYGRKSHYGLQRVVLSKEFHYSDFLEVRNQVLLSGYHSVFSEVSGGLDVVIESNHPAVRSE